MIRYKVSKTSLRTKLAENNHSAALDETKPPWRLYPQHVVAGAAPADTRGRWRRHKSVSERCHTSKKTRLGGRTATHSSVLAWRIPGTWEPGGLPSLGSHRVGHDWSDLAAAAAAYTVNKASNRCPESSAIYRYVTPLPICLLTLSLKQLGIER